MDVDRFNNFSWLLDRKSRGCNRICRWSFKIVVFYLFVELDTNDLKVMGAVKKGITTFGGIKNGVNLKKDELVKILDILDNSELIRSSSSTGLFGQKKLIIE